MQLNYSGNMRFSPRESAAEPRAETEKAASQCTLALSLALECRVNELALLTSADIVLVLTLKPGVRLVSILLPWLSLCCAPNGTTISDGPISVTDVTPGSVWHRLYQPSFLANVIAFIWRVFRAFYVLNWSLGGFTRRKLHTWKLFVQKVAIQHTTHWRLTDSQMRQDQEDRKACFFYILVSLLFKCNLTWWNSIALDF